MKCYCILRVINYNVPKGLSRIEKLNNLRKNVNMDEMWKIQGMLINYTILKQRNILSSMYFYKEVHTSYTYLQPAIRSCKFIWCETTITIL
jgi:hypothetical protein